jgi:hypothetical protein
MAEVKEYANGTKRVVLEMSIGAASVIEALLAALPDTEEALMDVSLDAWWALSGLKDELEDDWDFDCYTHAERAYKAQEDQ